MAACTSEIAQTKPSGERVGEVKASDRLVESPALAVNADKFMSPQMRRMMKAMNKDGADAPVKVNLEMKRGKWAKVIQNGVNQGRHLLNCSMIIFTKIILITGLIEKEDVITIMTSYYVLMEEKLR